MGKRILTICACAMLLCLAFPAARDVRAGSPSQGVLSVSPTSVDQEIAPGGSYTGGILVLNQGTVDYSYKVYVSPYRVTGEDYRPDFTLLPGAPDATKWFTFDDPTSISGELKAGAQESVPYTITVPQGTPAGSYDAVMFAETTGSGKGGVVTHERVGTIFYIRVSGSTELKGSVTSWSAPWLQQYPLTATLRLGNTGTVNYKATLNVTVSDMFGNTKYQFTREPEVLPQTVRRIDIPWENGAGFGLFKVSGQVSFNGQTYPLATKFVLVASPLMRLATIGLFIALILAMIALGRRRGSRIRR